MDQYTDIEFCAKFKEPIREDYLIAIDFIDTNPDYSLQKFRGIVECLCNKIAAHYKLDFDSDNLNEQIDCLYQNQLIYSDVKNALHELRMLCNAGVHKAGRIEGEGSAAFLKASKEKLQNNAHRARKLIVGLLEDAYIILGKAKIAPKVTMTAIASQHDREVIWQALTTQCAKAKMKAGLLCEALATDAAIELPFMVPENFMFAQESLYKQAAAHYEAAYKISAEVDNWAARIGSSYELAPVDEIVENLCDLEPLYHYALIASDGHLGEEMKIAGQRLLQIAADRGHAHASACYGSICYNEFNDYPLAFKYLSKAAEKGVTIAYRGLCDYYAQGKACEKNNTLALEYLQKGIDAGCADSLMQLGKAYHEGSFVEQDQQLAELTLLQAMDMGSGDAWRYHQIEFEHAEQTMTKDILSLQDFLMEQAKPRPVIATKKPGPNEKCPCGSGKKYKKCCRDNPIKMMKMLTEIAEKVSKTNSN
jgi:TPR repeat protein